CNPPHGKLELQASIPQRRQPAEELNSSWNHDHQRCCSEKALSHLRKTGHKHVVDPHTKSDESHADGRDNQRQISKDVPASEARDQSRDDRSPWQEDDVNVGMSEEPEQMLVEQHISTLCRVKELRAHRAIEQKHAARK